MHMNRPTVALWIKWAPVKVGVQECKLLAYFAISDVVIAQRALGVVMHITVLKI